ncbi:transmembrane protein, putative (macronuclear) [Tetrahymena thermophila SB210]|uniref:Transmembrane protein, putative n=1 Tax=Tetrahymena thermophila (strain SB210) TaxID=312017 RepID=W7XER0_TETTS|nr:transmembrane protein, putative [Tetrahymena thermophila SB210]EWS72381.1 transmembrane protein, putative [Tetrahymena thermophila SB210]|eukprot:XP_012655065.1 transmembrane protein, putative [Tetrahymena thermophila SB210]
MLTEIQITVKISKFSLIQLKKKVSKKISQLILNNLQEMKWLPENCLESISLTIVLDPIIFPSYFYMNGIIVSCIIYIISGFIVLHSSKIYTTIMEMKAKKIDQIIQFFLGQRWRLTYLIASLVYIMQLMQMYTLYINKFTKDIMVSFFPLDSLSQYIEVLVIPITSPMIISSLICNSTSPLKLGLKLNVVFLVSIVLIYIYIFISSFEQIKSNFDSSILTTFNLENLPYFISQNNYSFHFQLYLQELVVFNQNNKIVNKKIQQIVIYFALSVGLFFGVIGSLIVNDQEKQGMVNKENSNQLYQLLIFQYLTQFPVIVIVMKIFIIFNMLFNIGFKFVIFRQNLTKFLVEKKIKNFNENYFNKMIKVQIIIFILVLNLSTENQQTSLFIISGSLLSKQNLIKKYFIKINLLKFQKSVSQ